VEKWLEPLENTLAGLSTSVSCFFRDDDAGWSDDRLFRLIDCFSMQAVPLDLAAIPQAFDSKRASLLSRGMEASDNLVGIHQHGFCHMNYQVEGRKCEFGSARSLEQQKTDIRNGSTLLHGYFGDRLDSIFTPPWNRCTQNTVDVLNDLTFSAISRDETAASLDSGSLAELPVGIDWFKKKRGVRIQPIEIGAAIAAAVEDKDIVGIMLHHEHMDRHERSMLDALLALLVSSSHVKCLPMRDLAASC